MASRRSAILAAAGLAGATREVRRIFWQRQNATRRRSEQRLDALAAEVLSAPATDLDRLEAAWRSVVPAAHRQHSRVDMLSRGVLKVVVDSAASLYVLKLHGSAKMVSRLNAELGEALVRRIVFRVGATGGGAGTGRAGSGASYNGESGAASRTRSQ